MNKQIIKTNVVGRILEGDNRGWYIKIQEDFENSGGYLILVSDDQNFLSDKGFDYWVEKYDNLIGFFEESNWKIEWINDTRK
jgi:hypothetical protein